MESQPQNSELRIDPENFHPCIQRVKVFWNLFAVSTKLISYTGEDKIVDLLDR